VRNDGYRNSRTTTRSIILVSTGVTDIGRKSECCTGAVTFGIGFMTHVTCRLTAKNRDLGISSGTLRSVIEYGLPFLPFSNRAQCRKSDVFPVQPNATRAVYRWVIVPFGAFNLSLLQPKLAISDSPDAGLACL